VKYDQDEIEQLLGDYRLTGDRTKRNKVVECHMRMARFTVRRLARGDRELAEDLQQVALLAIVRAADRYRPSKGASFRTFAARTIDGELKRHLRDKTWTVRPPRTRQENFLHLCNAREALTQELGRGPTPVEIAERTGLDLDSVLDAMEAGSSRTPFPLDPPTDRVGAPPVRPELARSDRSYTSLESSIDLRTAIHTLDARQRGVLILRFGQELSQTEIAQKLGISQSYVSRLIRGALTKLRAEMDGDRFAAATSVPA